MNDEPLKQPLVSIVVITYNSAKYILETLESAKTQTYKNIELIVSDDGSTDETASLCRAWLQKNESRFVRTGLLTTLTNTGISANCNRGVNHANGEWVKLIAGDDILADSCVSSYMLAVQNDSNIKAMYAKFICFDRSFSDRNFSTPKYYGYSKFYKTSSTPQQQFSMLLRRNFCHGPTFFAEKKLLSSIGGFDEKYKFEDLPIALKITFSGTKLYFLDTVTVYYRTNVPSITNAQSSRILYTDFYKSQYIFNQEYVFPKAMPLLVFFKKMEFFRLYYQDKFGLNRKNFLCRVIHKVTYLLNPLNTYNTYF